MRHGLQRQTLMCASVIKCDLVPGIPPRANNGGVSLSLCHCSHQRVGETPYRLAFSAVVPWLHRDSPQQHSPNENQTHWITGRQVGAAESVWLTAVNMKKPSTKQNDKVPRQWEKIYSRSEHTLFGLFVISINFYKPTCLSSGVNFSDGRRGRILNEAWL